MVCPHGLDCSKKTRFAVGAEADEWRGTEGKNRKGRPVWLPAGAVNNFVNKFSGCPFI